ncbi:cysteine hydrolase [Methanosarcina sp. KYL-1]|uniref:cysteine hydrolase n=1 Tax=Methanosarcina sp. KYL-1 TaxID=2602068 RepID=UPI0021011F07|nr:cysteine hydrolase [Methanosarcina sp. KYL-1]MCQ1535753.1 cysteine hydrolase [Methanosarcina sp. KYL-1]
MTRVKREGTALIIVDAQHYVLHEKGFGAEWGVCKHAKETNMIGNTKKAIEKARATGMPVIYIVMGLRLEVLPDMGLWKEVKEINFKEVSPGGSGPVRSLAEELAIVEELTPHPEDFIVTKYNTMDAFHNTDLELILKGLKCDTLILTGDATNLCFETTVRSAFNRGYRCIVLSDCTATMNEEFQKFPINVIFPMLGEVTTVAELEIIS